MLYNHANAKFHTNHTTNPTTGKRTQIIEFTLSSVLVNHPSADKVANNNADTQIHTTVPKRIFPKNDHAVTSLGALSNIEISGFFTLFEFFKESNQICEFPIWGIPHKFESTLVIMISNNLKVWIILCF